VLGNVEDVGDARVKPTRKESSCRLRLRVAETRHTQTLSENSSAFPVADAGLVPCASWSRPMVPSHAWARLKVELQWTSMISSHQTQKTRQCASVIRPVKRTMPSPAYECSTSLPKGSQIMNASRAAEPRQRMDAQTRAVDRPRKRWTGRRTSIVAVMGREWMAARMTLSTRQPKKVAGRPGVDGTSLLKTGRHLPRQVRRTRNAIEHASMPARKIGVLAVAAPATAG
jgi:hypothetical protein